MFMRAKIRLFSENSQFKIQNSRSAFTIACTP